MSWSPERRYQHRQAMKRAAESNKCPVCGRRSAIVTRLIMGKTYFWCRWSDENKCTYTGNL